MNLGARLVTRIFLALLAASMTLHAAEAPTAVPAGARFEVEFLTSVGTATSHAGDKVEARLLNPLSVRDRQVLPRGALLSGRVVMVRPGNNTINAYPALLLGFDKLILPDGRNFPINVSLASMRVHSTEVIVVQADGLIEPETYEEREQDILDAENSNSGGGSRSLAGALIRGLTLGIVKGAAAGVVALRQYDDFTLKKGQKAKMLLDSDLVLAGEGQSALSQGRTALHDGTVSGNVYKNDFFGFSYTYPQGWHAQDIEAQKEVAQRGHGVAFGEKPDQSPSASAEEHREAMNRTRFLFGATQAAGSTMTPPSVQITAVDLSGEPSLPAPKTLLAEVSQGMTEKGALLIQPAAEMQIAGREFASAQYKLDVKGPDKTVQTWFEGAALTYDRDYALIWFFDANDQPGVDDLLKTLNGVAFTGGSEYEGTFVVYGERKNPLGWLLILPGVVSRGKFTQLVATVTFQAAPDGSYFSQSSCSKDSTTRTAIAADSRGEWASIAVTTMVSGHTTGAPSAVSQDRVRIVRQGAQAIAVHNSGKAPPSKIIIPVTVGQLPLQINWSSECSWDPGLLGPFIRLYDREKGGEQQFPVFDFVAGTAEGSSAVLRLNARGNTEWRNGDEHVHLTWYNFVYERPSWVMHVSSLLADDSGRIYIGVFPDWRSDKIFVRKGYEDLIKDQYVRSLLNEPSH